MRNLNLTVINLFGAPGVGKSTTAAGLFNLMKMRGHSVELIGEFAKDLTWEKNMSALGNQLLILGQQDHRQRRLVGQTRYVITDSPLPTGIAYMTEEYAFVEDATWAAFDRYDNRNVLLKRNLNLSYQEEGRNQTLEQAMVLDNKLDWIFGEAVEGDFAGPCLELTVSPQNAYEIYNWLAHTEGWNDGTA